MEHSVIKTSQNSECKFTMYISIQLPENAKSSDFFFFLIYFTNYQVQITNAVTYVTYSTIRLLTL